jgi:hypothetical protein
MPIKQIAASEMAPCEHAIVFYGGSNLVCSSIMMPGSNVKLVTLALALALLPDFRFGGIKMVDHSRLNHAKNHISGYVSKLTCFGKCEGGQLPVITV